MSDSIIILSCSNLKMVLVIEVDTKIFKETLLTIPVIIYYLFYKITDKANMLRMSYSQIFIMLLIIFFIKGLYELDEKRTMASEINRMIA